MASTSERAQSYLRFRVGGKNFTGGWTELISWDPAANQARYVTGGANLGTLAETLGRFETPGMVLQVQIQATPPGLIGDLTIGGASADIVCAMNALANVLAPVPA